MPVACTTYVLAAPEITRHTLERQDAVMPACEGETSMIMAVVPDLVHHDRLDDVHGPALGLTIELTGRLYTARSFADVTPPGVAGDARTATVAKGETLLDAYARSIAHAVMNDQPWARSAPGSMPPTAPTALSAQPAQS